MNKKKLCNLEGMQREKEMKYSFITQSIFEILEYNSKYYSKIIINLRNKFSPGPGFKPWSPALKRYFITKEVETKKKMK